MRILLTHNAYAKFSGEEAVVEDICSLLRSHGHDVIPFSRSSAEISNMAFGEVRAFLSGIYSFPSMKAMRRLLAESQPDIVHVHNLFPLISPSVLGECRRAGVPVVMTVHNYRLICPNGLHMVDAQICEKCRAGREYWCILQNCAGSLSKSIGYALRNYVARRRRYYLDNVSTYAVLSEFQRQRMVAEGFPAERVSVVPNMCRVNGCQVSDDLGGYVGYVGRVSTEKGIAILAESARRLHGVQFKVAGTYESTSRLVRDAPGNVDFCGFLLREQLHQFYTASRIIVLCSTCFEGFPLILLDAMAYGKPVVCSRIGGLPEIVDDGVTGLLFEPGNADELADKIRYLWVRPDACRQMGKAGRQKVLREYSTEKYYERLMAVYSKAIELGPPRG